MDYSCIVQTRDIKDPIHGNIKVYPALARFIDTYQFQRLRNIKQLGTTSYVWPAATHTRFEHSLGVAYLARKMATHLQFTQPELGISDRDVGCVEIAGLCHDLGHGPWSHVWDGLFIPSVLKDVKWTHEMGSEMMFDYLVDENQIPISDEDHKFIKALIAGDHNRVPNEKGFLFDIVANKRNGLDVDKCDYLRRDSHMCSHSLNLDIERLFDSARVLDGQICYNMKDINSVHNFFLNRFNMHTDLYNHKTTRAIEYMIVDALAAADPHLKIAQRIFNSEEYVYLTDHIMTEIESSKAPELAKSREILRCIHLRQLYRHVDFKTIEWPMRQFFWDNITPSRIMDEINKIQADKQDATTPCTLEESDVIVDFSTRSYGMRERNPVDFVRFYSKRNPHKSCHAVHGVITNVLPKYFAEDVLTIFTKKVEHMALVQAGYRAVLASLGQDSDSEPDDSSEADDNVEMTLSTPPDTDMEAPSTPKISRKASLGVIPREGKSKSSKSTPFSNNAFTTLPELPKPSSPSQGRGTKRRREADPSPV